MIHIALSDAQRVFGRQSIQNQAYNFDAFQFRQGLEVVTSKKFDIFLNDFVAKRMKGKNMNAVRVRPNKFQQTLAHSMNARISERQAQNIVWLSVRLHQNLTNASREHMRFARARSRNCQNGTLYIADSFPLGLIELLNNLREVLMWLYHGITLTVKTCRQTRVAMPIF